MIQVPKSQPAQQQATHALLLMEGLHVMLLPQVRVVLCVQHQHQYATQQPPQLNIMMQAKQKRAWTSAPLLSQVGHVPMGMLVLLRQLHVLLTIRSTL